MRFGFVVAVLLAGTVARADTLRSDPAFLGIAMSDYPQPGPQAMACQISSVTRGTGADAAGLVPGDVIVRLDGMAINSCDELTTIITSHSSGDSVPIELLGAGKRAVVAQLSSRTEVMRHGLIGHPLDRDLTVPDGTGLVPLDLSGRGRVTIVGWFHPRCTDCASVFARIAKWKATARLNVAYAATFEQAITTSTQPLTPAKLSDQFRLDVPVALASGNGLDSQVIFDEKRIVFMVIDAGGQVSYIGPVAPTADDLDAALDELFLAADHARADHTASPRAQGRAQGRAQSSRR